MTSCPSPFQLLSDVIESDDQFNCRWRVEWAIKKYDIWRQIKGLLGRTSNRRDWFSNYFRSINASWDWELRFGNRQFRYCVHDVLFSPATFRIQFAWKGKRRQKRFPKINLLHSETSLDSLPINWLYKAHGSRLILRMFGIDIKPLFAHQSTDSYRRHAHTVFAAGRSD